MASTQSSVAQAETGSTVATSGMSHEDTGLQFLTFQLDNEAYGVDILRVQEIKGWVPVTCIPNTPEYLKGVLNLRGTIVPIIDMRTRFNLEFMEYNAETVIIVLSVQTDSGERVVGIVVDSVSDVLSVKTEDMKPSPDFGTNVHTEFIDRLATVDEQMVMLLDID
ncbi:MAG: purine-binding chemotaxis protein CheW, partial [Gammaproteobacteria bacterium]|nr:purine-binding chemotaxis protein CheW [Gammaproteobacteria bacterium]